jgi:hypothetical protein
MTPRLRIRTSLAATVHAADLATMLTSRGCFALGDEPGAHYAETLAGHKLAAYRLRCGGIEIREVAA